MDAKPLPAPRSREDEYLHDIATSLRIMSGRNVVVFDHQDGPVELIEPAGGIEVVPVGGGGWHELRDCHGTVVEKVRGRRNAERRAAELREAS